MLAILTKIKIWLGIGAVAGLIAAGVYLNKVWNKAKERDDFDKQNKTLLQEKKALVDSLKLHKEWLAKSLIETKNAGELYALTKGMTASFQSVIAEMRDSVIQINKDRVKLQREVLELKKDLEAAKKKRKLF